ncbi:MAG: hypothetical protein H6543_03320 [Prevotellaceae bacterium]|jgi:hypothetical protein|nr:hypothetical protein [Prevotellaceae bacterium]
MAYIPTSINISAEQGQPSTFWKSETGLYYTTKADAVKDDKTKAVNPNDYAIQKSFWQQNKQAIMISLFIIAVIAGGLYLWKKGRIILKTT